MAKITVRTNASIGTLGTEHGVDRYTNATKWHVDDEQILHIVGSGNVGTYARGCWLSVRFEE